MGRVESKWGALMPGRMRTGRNRRLGTTCGAYARTTGLPCRAKLLLAGGRCRLHGGMSTGPRTSLGKERAIQALRKGWTRWDLRRRNRGPEHE
jgi:hypothetical protein